MAAGVLTGSTVADVAACQLACKADLKCQYFAFYNYNDAITGHNCYLRKAAATIAKITTPADLKSPGSSGFIIMFEVKAGIYTAYLAKDAADAGSVGTLIGNPANFDAAKTACDADAKCVGFSYNGAAWRTFAAAKWEGAVGKVRVVGETLNSWVAEPTP
jgi:hypothetical protein